MLGATNFQDQNFQDQNFQDPNLQLAIGTFEPCHAPRAEHEDGVCEECGWLAVEHHSPPLADVIVVSALRTGRARPGRSTLRRAS